MLEELKQKRAERRVGKPLSPNSLPMLAYIKIIKFCLIEKDTEHNMSMESLEFIIYPDGRVKETVTGMIGNSCEEVTEAIEAQLGKVIDREVTSEYFAAKMQQNVKTSNPVKYDNW